MFTPLVLVSLATYRITRIITSDLILSRLREWILIRMPNDDPIYTGLKKAETGFVVKKLDEPWRKPTFIGRLISCDYCISVWIAPMAYLAYLRAPQAIMVLAVMGLVYILSTYIGGHDE